jgi:hypothetical protein
VGTSRSTIVGGLARRITPLAKAGHVAAGRRSPDLNSRLVFEQPRDDLAYADTDAAEHHQEVSVFLI